MRGLFISQNTNKNHYQQDHVSICCKFTFMFMNTEIGCLGINLSSQPDNSFCSVVRASVHAGRPNSKNLLRLGCKCDLTLLRIFHIFFPQQQQYSIIYFTKFRREFIEKQFHLYYFLGITTIIISQAIGLLLLHFSGIQLYHPELCQKMNSNQKRCFS